MVKNLLAKAGDKNLIPGLGRSPGGGNGNPLQYACRGNSMDSGAWRATVHWAAKSQTRLSTQHTHSYLLCKDQLCFQRQPPLARAGKHSYHPLQQAHWGVGGLPWWLSRKESTCQCRRHGSDPWSRKIPHATEQLSTHATATEPVP